MHIELLSIRNFRGIKTGVVRFCPHTVLIGPSNCGKTTILEALALVLGRERLVSTLTEHDFFGSDPQPRDRIRIVATVAGFDPEEPSMHQDWFRDGRGVPGWLEANSGRMNPEPKGGHESLACQIAFAARFDRESLEVETARYFCDDEETDVFEQEDFVRVPQKLIRDLGFFLIPATRTWARMLSFGSELFKRVIRSDEGMPWEAVLHERDQLRKPRKPLDEDANIKPIIDSVNAEIRELVGLNDPLKLRLTATDSADVLETIVPHFVTKQQYVIPSRRQGSGLVSLQSLFLLLHSCRKRTEVGENFCMALEEPELHLAPATQRRVLTRLHSLPTQTIVSTHSSLVAGYSDPTSVLVVRNIDGELCARPMLEHPLQQNATNAVRKLFQVNRVELATAMLNEIVLVPEGRIDYDWLNLLTRVVELHLDSAESCVFGVKVGIIPTHESRIEETCKMLSKAHPQVCGLVDGDDAGMKYASQLAELEPSVRVVLSWPECWTIEDVICWIIEADECNVIADLRRDLEGNIRDLKELNIMLKSTTREDYGIKGDLVGYEVIANCIASHSGCLQRTCVMLNAVTKACAGEQTPYFENSHKESPERMVFTPCPQ